MTVFKPHKRTYFSLHLVAWLSFSHETGVISACKLTSGIITEAIFEDIKVKIAALI